MLKQIKNQVTETGFFALMADEAKSHKQELLAVCIRYVNGLEISETFLEFVDCSEKKNCCCSLRHYMVWFRKFKS